MIGIKCDKKIVKWCKDCMEYGQESCRNEGNNEANKH